MGTPPLTFYLRELRMIDDNDYHIIINCRVRREYTFNYDDDLQLEYLIEDKYNEDSVHQ